MEHGFVFPFTTFKLFNHLVLTRNAGKSAFPQRNQLSHLWWHSKTGCVDSLQNHSYTDMAFIFPGSPGRQCVTDRLQRTSQRSFNSNRKRAAFAQKQPQHTLSHSQIRKSVNDAINHFLTQKPKCLALPRYVKLLTEIQSHESTELPLKIRFLMHV